jgi:hypothetical protein
VSLHNISGARFAVMSSILEALFAQQKNDKAILRHNFARKRLQVKLISVPDLHLASSETETFPPSSWLFTRKAAWEIKMFRVTFDLA